MTVRTSAVLAAAMFMTSACSTWRPSADSAATSAVDYNRAFARARDQITVLNVLRASERQPLQFSTVSSVQGSLKTGTSVKVPFTNIIAGGTDSISPEVTITGSNPVVSIIPLATKEFIRGISRPIEPQLIDDLLAQGWKKEVVLPLVVGGVVCPHRRGEHLNPAADFIQINDGDDREKDRAFLEILTSTNTFALTAPPELATLRVTSKDALSFLKDGVGANNTIESITPVVQKGGGAEEALVRVVVPGKVQIVGLDFSRVCKSADQVERAPDGDIAASAPTGKHGVVLRSVLGMFRYLGHAQAFTTERELARCEGHAAARRGQGLFNVRVNCDRDAISPHNVVSTSFQGHEFYVPPARESELGDPTLDTLALLSYLVGLQTSEVSLRGASPFVTITQ